METEEARRRPISITVLAVLYGLAAPLLFFFGTIFFLLMFAVGGASTAAYPRSFEEMFFGYFFMFSVFVLPFALALVASGLWWGKRWARSGTVPLSLVNLAFVWYAFAYGFMGGLQNGFFTLVLLFDTLTQFAIVRYMFTPTAKRYFGATASVHEGRESLTLPRRFIAYAILVIIVVSVLPLIIFFLFQQHQYSDVAFQLQIEFWGTLPAGISLAAAYLLARSYLVHGRVSVLAFGSAVLMWGWVNVASTFFSSLIDTQSAWWAAASAGSVGLLLSSMLHLSGVFPSVRGSSSKSSSKPRLVLAYVFVTIAAAALVFASYNGLAPAFFGIMGSTLLDQGITALAIVLFSASSIFFFVKARRDAKPLFLYWYAAGLAIFAVAYISSVWEVWSVTGYLAALAIVAGCLCFFVSALVHLKESLNQQATVHT